MKNTTRNLYLYIFSLFIITIGLTCWSSQYAVTFSFDFMKVVFLIAFSILNVVAYLHPIPIVEKENEKSVGMGLFINMVSLLLVDYYICVISSIAGILYHLIKNYILKKQYQTIYRPVTSLFSILISVNVLFIVFSSLGGKTVTSIDPLFILIFIVATLINFVINGFILSTAFFIEFPKNSILTNFKTYFLWVHRFILWDAIYSFTMATMILWNLKVHGDWQYLSTIAILIVMYYPIHERIRSLQLNVQVNKQNQQLTNLTQELLTANDIAVKAFLAALEAKDSYTKEHSVRVSTYAVALAKEFGFSSEKVRVIELAGYLHDVGKMKISEAILNKTQGLTDEEYKEIKNHTVYGLEILKKMYKENTENEEFKIISNIAIMHHERIDGKGYPYGLTGDQMPLEARILAVVDTFDAMTTTRSYRKALSLEEARNEIERCAGTQFCPEVARIFIKCIDENKIKVLTKDDLPL